MGKSWNYGNLSKKKKKKKITARPSRTYGEGRWIYTDAPWSPHDRFTGEPDAPFRYRPASAAPEQPVSSRKITPDEYAAMQAQSGQLHDTLKDEEFTPYAKIALASGPPVPLMFSYDFPAHGQYFTAEDYDTETFKGAELVGKEDITGSGGQKEAEQYFLEQVARHPGTTTTASEKISGRGNAIRWWHDLSPRSQEEYKKKYGQSSYDALRRTKDKKIKGTGYDIYSRIKPGTQYMGINPHKGWGDGMRSREEIFNTVNHELEHYGYDEWHKIVEKDSRLYNKLLIKYGKGIINNALLNRWDEFDPELRGHPLGSGTFMAEHPAIYSQSSWKPYREPPYTIDEEGNKKWTEDGRTPKEMTPVLKEIIDQEILPYFKKLLPSLKEYKSLQGPAYGLTKTTGRTMKKRDYQESLLRDKASYAVESRKRRHYESGDKERNYVLQNLRGLKYDVPARIYKGDWNYRDKALEKIDILDWPEVVPSGDFSLPKKTRKSTKSKKRSWNY